MTTPTTIPRTKTDRFLASFQAVAIQPEHRKHGSETPCLKDCVIAPAIATKLIRWAEHEVGQESLVCTLQTNAGRVVKMWHWMEPLLQAAFKMHTEMFGEKDLPEAARRMRDTGSCWAN
ncbi:hypothetical protein [Diaphorobacter caeni]|uniref:hypothetical protein n=1 Tax=Diaphorobacter caeni TaxID=2784387 RepID=UPI00188FF161|nr:hypothetical protein [Diaphorobacter caeni]MBF5007835.1 hypothetical protein [Diaphorobacter caeni]